jgi:hypothetical protein
MRGERGEAWRMTHRLGYGRPRRDPTGGPTLALEHPGHCGVKQSDSLRLTQNHRRSHDLCHHGRGRIGTLIRKRSVVQVHVAPLT